VACEERRSSNKKVWFLAGKCLVMVVLRGRELDDKDRDGTGKSAREFEPESFALSCV
jgi:hypothetical protein